MKVAIGHDDLSFVARNAFDHVSPFTGQFEGRLHSFSTAVHGDGHLVAGHLRNFFVKERQLIVAESP
ncbi:hypothetical protein SDC9_136114 [bioreactor metagenome]|uniref:Uncharacterized protein n=1 Tax=bioreactor metagenome TaxID=1076179 RepID=A0A645DI64_9ZZZZ